MKIPIKKTIAATAVFAAVTAFSQSAVAIPVDVTVRVTNLAPQNGIAFAPLRIGFNNGTFDAFNEGATAPTSIVSVAEGGSGSAWFPAFAAADPTATLGTVGGLLLAGANASATFRVDTAINRFFTFASMVVPSNDLFIGNDSPTEYQLFDASGALLFTSIEQNASEIWDAGSETANPANAAFVQGGVNAQRTPQNGVVSFNFGELNAFNGQTTGAGYVFSNGLNGDTAIYRIEFSATPVPVPATLALAGIGLIGLALTRRPKIAAN
jgi:PEP-CTERM motif